MTILTPEQVYDSYEYKVSKKILMQRYPWIKDIYLDNIEDINKWGLIFIIPSVDLIEFAEAYNFTITSWLSHFIKQDEQYEAPFLNLLVQESATHITMEMDKILENIHKSPAIPEDMKLPRDRRLHIGGYTAEAQHNQKYLSTL